MPAVSKSQQRAAGLALSAKRGEISPSELTGAAKSMYDSMTEKELEDFANTKIKDLPEKLSELGINYLQTMAGIYEALPAGANDANAMIRELSLLLQLLSDVDIDKALSLDLNSQRQLTKIALEMNKLLKSNARILRR